MRTPSPDHDVAIVGAAPAALSAALALGRARAAFGIRRKDFDRNVRLRAAEVERRRRVSLGRITDRQPTSP